MNRIGTSIDELTERIAAIRASITPERQAEIDAKLAAEAALEARRKVIAVGMPSIFERTPFDVAPTHVPCRFATFGDVLRGVRDTYGAEGSESRALAQWTGCRILCLDDIGKEKPTADALEKLFALLDARYRSGKPTLFTTQYQSPKELGHRLMESGGDKPTAQAIVRRVFGGGDYQAEVVRC